jgi:iron complex outermembrane receptor protein
VIGRGEARQVQRVTAEDMKVLPPGANPLKLLATKPGVHFESADATGAYEWSTTISLRGFNQNRLGYTLDGIPLGNMAYGNSNGLHISRAVISENRAVPRSPPASARWVRRPPATSAACSSSIRSIRPPSMAWCWRRASAATVHAAAMHAWRPVSTRASPPTCPACIRRRQVEGQGLAGAEAVQRQGHLQLRHGQQDHRAVQRSRRVEADYQDLSLEMIDRLGWDWDNYAPDWDRAVAAARGKFSGGVNSPWDAYYSATACATMTCPASPAISA